MPNRPPGTGGRASLWRLSQSSSPHKCRSYLGFSLVTVQTWWVELGERRLIGTCLGVRNGGSPPIFDLQTLGSPQV